jgi:hypothetical protein
MKRRLQSRQGSSLEDVDSEPEIAQAYLATSSRAPRLPSTLIPNQANSARLSMSMARSHTPVATRGPIPSAIQTSTPMIPAPLNTGRSNVSNGGRTTPMNGRSTTPLPIMRSPTPLNPFEEPLAEITHEDSM